MFAGWVSPHWFLQYQRPQWVSWTLYQLVAMPSKLINPDMFRFRFTSSYFTGLQHIMFIPFTHPYGSKKAFEATNHPQIAQTLRRYSWINPCEPPQVTSYQTLWRFLPTKLPPGWRAPGRATTVQMWPPRRSPSSPHLENTGKTHRLYRKIKYITMGKYDKLIDTSPVKKENCPWL